MRIDSLGAPLTVGWQLTRLCDLACLHCCTASSPSRSAEGELSREEAVDLARRIVEGEVPYAMLCGGEPLLSGHFFEVVEILGAGGVQLKIESNGQRFGVSAAERLAALPVRSVQISLDAVTQEAYGRQRPGASLEKARSACEAVRGAGMPLEVTFAPTRFNIAEAEAVLEDAAALGAFRFNTGRLMRLGRALSFLDRIEPSEEEYARFLEVLRAAEGRFAGRMEVCYRPFTLEEALRSHRAEPPATLLVLPDGKVQLSGALPRVCADLRRQGLAEAWKAYRAAWRLERAGDLVAA